MYTLRKRLWDTLPDGNKLTRAEWEVFDTALFLGHALGWFALGILLGLALGDWSASGGNLQ